MGFAQTSTSLTIAFPGGGLEVGGLLFDIDGTLVDSGGAIEAAWRRVAEEFGAPADEVVIAAAMRRAAEVVDMFFAPDVRATALELTLTAAIDSADLVAALPGARELLAALPADRWGCVTSGRRAVMAARLEAAGLPVPAVLVAAEDVDRGKPEPDGYLLGAQRLGLSAYEVAAFEDSPVGIAAARAAGMTAVAVGTTRADADLKMAHRRVPDLRDLRVVRRMSA